MRLLRHCAAASILLLAAAAPLAAQNITGRVLDAASGAPVPQAVVTAVDANGRNAARARSTADGAFELQLRAPGTFRLRAERAGYQPTLSQTFDAAYRETVVVDLRLSVEPIAIEPMTVTARRQPPRLRSLEMAGFYKRERIGQGHFLHREDFERHSTNGLAEVIDRVPGTHLRDLGPGRRFIYFERAMGMSRERLICYPALYLDGVRVTYGPGTGLDLEAAIPANQVEAVEVYRSASEIPVEFNNSEANCGVIAVWTRSSR